MISSAETVDLDKKPEISVSLLTGGGDKPYAFGLITELMSRCSVLDVIGSNDLDCPKFRGRPGLHFFNLRGDQSIDVSLVSKVYRVLLYYAKLVRYALTAEPRIFHLLWNNKFENFDRTILMLYYRLLGKKTVLTVHNVNRGRRDSTDSWFNRLTLRFQYRSADHLFVHTEKMKGELTDEFGVSKTDVSVIPFGINNQIPVSALSSGEAKHKLGIGNNHKTILFFGNITPYKGLEYLIAAFRQLAAVDTSYRLVIAGWPKNCEGYWLPLRASIEEDVRDGRIILRAEYIPDEETEIYFKAADVLALPYRHVYQSGVLFLGYSFGLPALVADVGALKDDVIVGRTGFVFAPEDADSLAQTIEEYFGSELYAELSQRRQEITDFAREHHSWETVGKITMAVYADLCAYR